MAMNHKPWIDINLPWSTEVLGTAEHTPPDLSQHIKKEFGTTPADAWKQISSKEIDEYYQYDDQCQEELRKENSPILHSAVESYDDELLQRYGTKNGVAKVVAYHQLLRRMRVWEAAQPNQKSFCGRGLNQPGTLVIVDGEQFLIGDINPLRGVCDDCTAFARDAIVQRYKVVWEES
jgi:hypothetical protein